MNKQLVSLLSGSAMLLGMTALHAAPFNSFDPKTMAMGGAGVAVANPGTAPFFNPALLSIAEESDDFALELPIVGARAYDPDEFGDAVDDFQAKDYITKLDNSVNALIPDPLSYRNVANDTLNLNNGLKTLDGKPIQAEAGAAIVVGIPSRKFGMAFSASGSASFDGVINYTEEDSQLLVGIAQDTNAVSDCINANLLVPGSCDPAVDLTLTYVDPTTDTVLNADGQPFDPNTDISSNADIRGLILGEVGLSFSRELTFGETKLAVGLTPKYVKAIVFDYNANVDSADDSDADSDNYTHEYSNFNLDIGLAKDFQNGWRSGFVVKNVFSQDYEAYNTDPVTGVESKTGNKVSIKPQARIGVSRTTSWTTLALDVDLTENDPLGLGEKSRYVAFGAEFNAFRLLQLRAGYRADTVNSERNVVSAGIGASPLGIHIDLGVAGNDNEVGAALQIGFRF